MKTRFWILLFLSIAVVCAGLSVWLLGGKAETTAEVYSDGALVQTIDLAVDGLRITVIMFPFVGAQIVIGNFFQSIGKAKISIFLSLTRQLLYLLPCLLLFPNWWGLKGIWISMPVSDALAFITAVVSLIIYIKKVSKQHPIAE
jgi:Na+-driven multidrug efflux pump